MNGECPHKISMNIDPVARGDRDDKDSVAIRRASSFAIRLHQPPSSMRAELGREILESRPCTRRRIEI